MVAQSPQKRSACTATQPKIDWNITFQLSWCSAETSFPIKHQSFLLYSKHWTDTREPEQLWIRMSLKWLIVSSIIIESLCCLLDILFVLPCELVPSTAVQELLVQSSGFKAIGLSKKTPNLKTKHTKQQKPTNTKTHKNQKSQQNKSPHLSEGIKFAYRLNKIHTTHDQPKDCNNKETDLEHFNTLFLDRTFFLPCWIIYSLKNTVSGKAKLFMNSGWTYRTVHSRTTPSDLHRNEHGRSKRTILIMTKTFRCWVQGIKAKATKGYIQP